MILLDFFDGCQEVLVVPFFLRLKFREFFRIFKHFAWVLVSLVLNFILLLVQKFSALHFLCVFWLFDLSQQGLLLVLCWMLLWLKLSFPLCNCRLLWLNIQLNVYLHVSLLLVLTLGLELLFIGLKLLNFVFVRQNLLRWLKLLQFVDVSLWILVFDIKDSQHCIHSHWKQVWIRKRDTHPRDGLRMGLNLACLL